MDSTTKRKTLRRLTASPKETGQCAKKIARLLSDSKNGRATVVGLSGELGVGKTVFARELLRALGVKGKIVSPTFVLLREYKTLSSKYPNAYHADAYRLSGPGDAKPLRLGELMKGKRNLLLIEWPERIKGVIPNSALMVRFRHGRKSNERVIEFLGQMPKKRKLR